MDNGQKLAQTLWQKPSCFCQSGRKPGRNMSLPWRFKPVLAETCQHCFWGAYSQSKHSGYWPGFATGNVSAIPVMGDAVCGHVLSICCWPCVLEHMGACCICHLYCAALLASSRPLVGISALPIHYRSGSSTFAIRKKWINHALLFLFCYAFPFSVTNRTYLLIRLPWINFTIYFNRCQWRTYFRPTTR